MVEKLLDVGKFRWEVGKDPLGGNIVYSAIRTLGGMLRAGSIVLGGDEVGDGWLRG